MNTIRLLKCKFTLLLCSMVALIATSCSFSPSNTFNKTENKASVRIVSLVPSITQSIYQLNGQNCLVGCTSYCKVDPSDSIRVVSSAVKANIEAIAALKPDLILSSSLIPPKDIEALRRLGLRVEEFNTPKSFEEICAQFENIAEIVGRADNARNILSDARQAVKEVSESSAFEQAPKMFMQIGASPIFAVMKNTFMADYMTFLGGINMADSLSSGVVSREFVVAGNPEYIFVVTMGNIGEEEVEEWKKFKTLRATSQQHIYTLNSDVACEPTPLTFVQTLRQMNKYIKQ